MTSRINSYVKSKETIVAGITDKIAQVTKSLRNELLALMEDPASLAAGENIMTLADVLQAYVFSASYKQPFSSDRSCAFVDGVKDILDA